MCEDMHDFPKNKCFPTNQPLLKLLKQEMNVFNSSFSHCDTLEKLKACLKSIQKQKTDLDSFLNKGVDQIRTHCLIVKASIEQAAENSMQNILKAKGELINELNAYQSATIEIYEKNKTHTKDKFNFVEIYSEIEQFELNYNKFDPLQAIKLAENLASKLSSTKTELETLLFNGSLIEFSANENPVEASQIGYFNYFNSNSINHNFSINISNCNNTSTNTSNNSLQSNTLSFGKLSKTDFNLNKLLEKKTPFQFRSDLNFQVLDNGNYAITFKDSNDKLYYLSIFSANFTLIKTINLPLQSDSSMIRMFNHKNNVLISNSSNWCNRLIVIDESFELKSKDFEQDDEVLSVTANENYIFCLLSSSNINFHDWNLEFINSFTPSLDENLPFCVPTDISQLEIVDGKFIFKFENKIRIFDEDGRLLNETFITYDEFIVNRSKNQIAFWNREVQKIVFLDASGNSLNQTFLQDFSNENLILIFDNFGNQLFVDLKNFLLFKEI